MANDPRIEILVAEVLTQLGYPTADCKTLLSQTKTETEVTLGEWANAYLLHPPKGRTKSDWKKARSFEIEASVSPFGWRQSDPTTSPSHSSKGQRQDSTRWDENDKKSIEREISQILRRPEEGGLK